MFRLRDLSIRKQLSLIVMVPSGIALLLAAAILTVYERHVFLQDLKEVLTSEAQILTENCGQTLAQGDRADAEKRLVLLAMHGHIKSACLFDVEGKVFACSHPATAGQDAAPAPPKKPGLYMENELLSVYKPVRYEGKLVGAIGISADLHFLQERQQERVLTMLAVFLCVFLLTSGLQRSLHRFITKPLRVLADTARQVSENNDYSIRAPEQGANEIGFLTDQINLMMSRVEDRERALQQSRDTLEERVRERTKNLVEEITDRRQVEKTLRASEAKYRELVQNANSIILRMDPAGAVTFFNEFAQAFFGFSEDEILGKNVVGTIVPPLDSTERDLSALIADIGRDPERYARNENENMRRNGERVWVAWTNKAIRDEAGQVAGVLCIGNDITARKQTEEELRKAKEMAEDANSELEEAIERANRMAMAAEIANAAKSQFLANMSHEIRTPMNGVMGMTSLLLETSLTPEQREYAQTVRDSADSLLAIINDILDFSKIEAGRLELEQINFDVRDAVEHVVDLLAIRAMDKGLDLACLVEPDVPGWLRGDPGRIRQILLNLLGNALKFTEHGEVLVEVSLVEENSDEAKLRFAVRDTGIGIPQDAQGSVFEPFLQVDASTTRRYGGTGLGLAISKQLVSMMGGQMGLESEEGQGSTFWFTLPLEKVPIDARPAPLAMESIVGKRILVVDDNATNRRILERQFRSWGMRHAEAISGAQALSMLKEALQTGEPFDIAVIDMMMPEMDGAELGRRIKSDPALQRTALIMLTSLGRTGDATRMRQLGFAAYLTKPIKHSQLYECLVRALTHPGRFEPMRAMPPAPPAPAKESNPARILLAEDNLVNQKVALRMLKRFGCTAECVENGKAALEAHQQNPFDMILMDIQMPIMDGLEATGAIREWEAENGAHTPIVAMTAHALKSDEERCLQAGMDAYLSKPIEADALRSTIERLLKTRIAPQKPSPATIKAASKYDIQPLLQRVENDAALCRNILTIFLKQTPGYLTELRRHLEFGELEAAARQAHLLKGTAATVEALELRDRATQIFDAAQGQNLEAARQDLPRIEEAFELLRPQILQALEKSLPSV